MKKLLFKCTSCPSPCILNVADADYAPNKCPYGYMTRKPEFKWEYYKEPSSKQRKPRNAAKRPGRRQAGLVAQRRRTRLPAVHTSAKRTMPNGATKGK